MPYSPRVTLADAPFFWSSAGDAVARAELFACAAHAAVGQMRKYTGEDYIHHPIEVARTVADFGGTKDEIVAAVLHDVLEDTKVTRTQLSFFFGENVADMVEGLSDVSKPEDGNRAQRKAIDRAHTASGDASVQSIKCADLISNTRSISVHDHKFAATYLVEKALLLKELTKARPLIRRKAIDTLFVAVRQLRDAGIVFDNKAVAVFESLSR